LPADAQFPSEEVYEGSFARIWRPTKERVRKGQSELGSLIYLPFQGVFNLFLPNEVLQVRTTVAWPSGLSPGKTGSLTMIAAPSNKITTFSVALAES